jgi:hypothetical protein
MAHFALVDKSNIVQNVLVVPDTEEERGSDYLSQDMGLGGVWIKTSYNTRGGVHLYGGTPLRMNYAGIGYTYDPERDAFIPPKPEGFDAILNEDTCLWDFDDNYRPTIPPSVE